jgi:hypothetical protein
MNETFLFIWGVIATLFAVGPLAVAAILDWRAKKKQR